MANKILKHKFMGKTYEVDVDEPHYGYCDVEKPKHPRLVVNHGIDDKEGFNTLIHECLHACYPRISEKRIAKAANDIVDLLWALGFRRSKRKGSK